MVVELGRLGPLQQRDYKQQEHLRKDGTIAFQLHMTSSIKEWFSYQNFQRCRIIMSVMWMRSTAVNA
eukprot:3232165-Ditylum_brightwellii.AAC.1